MRRIAPIVILLPVLGLGQVNLNFQDGRAGEVPPGWFVMDPSSLGFTASWQHDGCHGGSPCAMLSAPANSPPGNTGTLMQTFAAAPFRGRQVRLRAWVREAKKTPADRARLLLHVTRQNFQEGFADATVNPPAASAEWAQYEIKADVPADAETIQIGLWLYGSGRAWIDGIEFGPAAPQTSGPGVDAAREAVGKQYARMDAAFMRGDGKEIAAVLMPGAQMGVGTIREPLLPAIQGEIAKGETLTARTEVTSLSLDGDEAIVMVRREAQDPKSGGQRTVVTSHRDTWIHTSGGWRWRESIEVSYHWVLPPTSADAARPVIAELKTRAVPAGGDDELAAFGAAVGDARIVVLGEAARGTREFREIKQRLVEYLFAHKAFTILAAAEDADAPPRAGLVPIDGATPENLVHLANVDRPQAKIVVWTDNLHARDPELREKLGGKLYTVGFAFDRGDFRAVGVEKGESKGLGTYAAQASLEGSGDAVLNGAGIPRFFLNMAKLPSGGALARWLAEMHLFHDLGAYWVLDDPDASLQPEQLGWSYDGLYYVEEVHAGS